jgi:CubicO group peptidase (beta-lactamase class C family)
MLLRAGVVLSLCFSAAQAGDLDGVLKGALAGTQTPAVTVLVMKDGKAIGSGVTGVRRNDAPDPARPDDVWLIGSDAKPMTAALIARLVDRGALSWNTPLSTLLPELAGGMRPEYRDVTLVQLLSHRAGLPHDDASTDFFMTFFKDTRPPAAQRLAYLAHALKDAPEGPVGVFNYSNTGFLLAAAAAEHATGLSYEALMRREVFAPLGMTSVGFGVTGEGQPQGHHGGKVATLEEANPPMFAPAGNLHLSMADWAKFCLDQMAGMHGGGKLLRPATYRMMETRLPGADTGLAWGVQDSVAGFEGPVLTHAGSDGNWYALVALFPGTQSGLLIAANAGEDMGGDKAAKAVFKALIPEVAKPLPATPATSP